MSSQRRVQILDAAAIVFEKRGFGNATLEEIAVQAKISKSLIFYHFESKFELLALLYKRAGSILFDNLQPILLDRSLSPLEKIERAIDTHVEIAAANQVVFRIYFRESHELPEKVRQELIGDGERRYVTALQTVIQDGIAAGVFQNVEPRVCALGILGACNWLTLWYRPSSRRRERGDLAPAEIANDFKTMMLGGLAPGVARRAPANAAAKPKRLRASSKFVAP